MSVGALRLRAAAPWYGRWLASGIETIRGARCRAGQIKPVRSAVDDPSEMRTLWQVILVPLFAVGCTPAPTAGVVDRPAQVSTAQLQLGRVICGDCCVEQVKRAFRDLDDVAAIHMQPGDVDFTVDYVGKALSPQRLADALVAAGVYGAQVSDTPVVARAEKRWVVAMPPR